jgi:hypothetical protein
MNARISILATITFMLWIVWVLINELGLHYSWENIEYVIVKWIIFAISLFMTQKLIYAYKKNRQKNGKTYSDSNNRPKGR